MSMAAPCQPKNFCVERNFHSILNMYDPNFLEMLERKYWTFLLYNAPHHFYCPELVKEFYASIALGDIDLVSGRILVNWRGEQRLLDRFFLSYLTGIPLKNGNQNPHPNLEVYRSIMGEDSVVSDEGGIVGRSMYRNLFAWGRFFMFNCVSSSHKTNFHAQTLHLIHVMQTRDLHFLYG